MKNIDSAMIFDTPESIEARRLITLRHMLRLEILGMKSRQGSAYAYIKKNFGFCGSKKSVLDQYTSFLKERNILAPSAK
jgi:hypothetical protein